MPPKKMSESAFLRYIRANPDMYNIPGQTTDPKWIAKQELIAEATGGIGQDYDYGMMDGRDARGHGGDAGKLPWHPTFSTQSAFSTQANPGGVWGETADGKTWFQPPIGGNTPEFRRYMKEVEPDVLIGKPEHELISSGMGRTPADHRKVSDFVEGMAKDQGLIDLSATYIPGRALKLLKEYVSPVGRVMSKMPDPAIWKSMRDVKRNATEYGSMVGATGAITDSIIR